MREEIVINKQNLWFLTLFSLILVLSVYYITMPSELLLTNNSSYNTDDENTNVVEIEESDILTAMRISLDEERLELQNTLQETLTSNASSSEDKNKAYEELKHLDEVKGKEEALENKIKTTFQLENFVKIDGNEIQVVAVTQEHNNELANNIMRAVQEEFKEKVYVTVKFEK